MGWTEIAALIVRFGIQGAFDIWRVSQSYPDGPTDGAWDELRKLTLKDYDTYIIEARERAAGLPLPPEPPPS